MKNLILNSITFVAFLFIAFSTNAITPDYCSPSETEPNTLVTLRAGTIVSLALNEEINSNTLEVGNTLDFLVRSNVIVNGKVVISTGSIAEGWVKKIKKGCNGACAEITITVENVQSVDGQRIYLRSIPHKIKADCCNDCENEPNETSLQIGTKLSARILNDVEIDA